MFENAYWNIYNGEIKMELFEIELKSKVCELNILESEIPLTNIFFNAFIDGQDPSCCKHQHLGSSLCAFRRKLT